MSDIGNVNIPGQPDPTGSTLIRTLTIVTSALTATSVAMNLALQIAHHFEKRPVGPDQRDRVATAGLAILVLRQLPGLIKHVRLLADQLKKAS